ncbi:hypothetical protein BAE29_03325 [Acidithiobacillus caldus]|jgi:hypothetical protein|uniref:Uncharacterized protein n=1 Tax=Acidithiobacillus caldus TaxID=33059 RepID=A0A1E7YQ53_9PROT|nr:hypothetical protein BAE28_10750 [Acidithiobacillus caldus]OFC38298.1 hypothetical protein BAE27_02360 [Acidithiobacillus caldus]OFC41271.1 hypothetical protein BAE29_03325 [Acidithiobacillus caldus]
MDICGATPIKENAGHPVAAITFTHKGESLQQMSQLAEKDAQGNPFFGGGSAGAINGSGGPS